MVLSADLQQSPRAMHVTLMSIELDVPSAVVRRALTSGPEGSGDNSTSFNRLPVSIPTPFTKPLSKSVPIPNFLDNNSKFYSIPSKEPRLVGSNFDTISPMSIHLINISRIASLDQLLASTTSNEPSSIFSSSSSAISILGLHLLLTRATRTSSLSVTVGQHVEDITASFVDLCMLNKERRKGNDRLPIHVSDLADVIAGLKFV